jgi:hypothetical protein
MALVSFFRWAKVDNERKIPPKSRNVTIARNDGWIIVFNLRLPAKEIGFGNRIEIELVCIIFYFCNFEKNKPGQFIDSDFSSQNYKEILVFLKIY